MVRPRAPYIAACCDRQYRPKREACRRKGFPGFRAGTCEQSARPGRAAVRTARPWPVRLRPAARSRTGPRRGRGRRRRISGWRRRRAAGSPWKRRNCRTTARVLRSSSTSSAPLPRCTERLRRSVGSSTPCSASSASMLPAAFGGAAERGSRRPMVAPAAKNRSNWFACVLLADDPSVVPFGP